MKPLLKIRGTKKYKLSESITILLADANKHVVFQEKIRTVHGHMYSNPSRIALPLQYYNVFAWHAKRSRDCGAKAAGCENITVCKARMEGEAQIRVILLTLAVIIAREES